MIKKKRFLGKWLAGISNTTGVPLKRDTLWQYGVLYGVRRRRKLDTSFAEMRVKSVIQLLIDFDNRFTLYHQDEFFIPPRYPLENNLYYGIKRRNRKKVNSYQVVRNIMIGKNI